MPEYIFSYEAEFVYGLLVKHYQQGKITDHSSMIELEEFESFVGDENFEAGLEELKSQALVTSYESYMDGSFYVSLRLKCENMLKEGQKTLNLENTSQNVGSHPQLIAPTMPEFIKKMIDKGLIATDGKTVITNSLDTVAQAIDEQGIIVTNTMLSQFINGKTGEVYSSSSIKKAVELVNAK